MPRSRQVLIAARKLVVLVIGLTIVAVGLALLVLPGPGLLVIVAGLALLALEFAWAARLLEHAREQVRRAHNRRRRGRRGRSDDASTGATTTK